jgi:hypothetical protein
VVSVADAAVAADVAAVVSVAADAAAVAAVVSKTNPRFQKSTKASKKFGAFFFALVCAN